METQKHKPRIPFLYNVGDVVKGCLIVEQVITTYYSEAKCRECMCKKYLCKCLKCGYEHLRDEASLKGSKGNRGCKCCLNQVVVEHINSIVANEETHWMVDYFLGGWNEAKKYSPVSSDKVVFKCAHCGRVSDKAINVKTLYSKHSIGCNCELGKISYGERVVRNALKEMNIEYIFQYRPKWSNGRYYDFFIPHLNCIIEIHGEQHYRHSGFFKCDGERQQQIDDEKETVARQNGIENYYQVNFRHTNISWMQKNIAIVDCIDWSNVDWVSCTKPEEKNIVKEVCTYKEQHKDITSSELGALFGISSSCARRYVQKGYELGWCTSSTFKRKDTRGNGGRPVVLYKNNSYIGEFRSATLCAEFMLNEYGIITDRRKIQGVANGEQAPEELKIFSLKFKDELITVND